MCFEKDLHSQLVNTSSSTFHWIEARLKNGSSSCQPFVNSLEKISDQLFIAGLEAPTSFYSRSWRSVDDRFFFNKALVQELIDLNDSRADAWIVPFIQGYVEIQECPLGEDQHSMFRAHF